MRRRFKIKNPKIFGIPLYVEPGMRPGNAPDWVYKWWNRAVRAWADLMIGGLIAVAALALHAIYVMHEEKPSMFYQIVLPEWSSWQEKREAARIEHIYGDLFGDGR